MILPNISIPLFMYQPSLVISHQGWTNMGRKRSTWRPWEHFYIHESWSSSGSPAGHPLLRSLETTGIPVGLSQLRGSRCLQEEDAWPRTSVDVKNVRGKEVCSLENTWNLESSFLHFGMWDMVQPIFSGWFYHVLPRLRDRFGSHLRGWKMVLDVDGSNTCSLAIPDPSTWNQHPEMESLVWKRNDWTLRCFHCFFFLPGNWEEFRQACKRLGFCSAEDVGRLVYVAGVSNPVWSILDRLSRVGRYF